MPRRKRRFVNLGLVCSLALNLAICTGCAKPGERVRPGEPGTTGGSVTAQRLVVGNSVEGRPIECYVLGQGPTISFILASIHGNESAGTPLVLRLREYLTENPQALDGHKVVLMPVANPDGVVHNQRHNVHGVDLNRNFPATNFQSGKHYGSEALSEPESVALHRVLLEYKPASVVSLHQPLNYGSACIDYDGPAAGLAQAMAARCDLPVKRLGSLHGSLGSFVGLGLKTPIITVELPKEATGWSADRVWQGYGEMLLAAVRFSPAASNEETKEEPAR